MRHWRRPEGYYGPASLDLVVNEELVYVVSDRGKTLRKVGIGGPGRIAFWENRAAGQDPWHVDQFLSLGEDRDAALSIETFVKDTVCRRTRVTEVYMARDGKTEAWPYEWGDLLLENLQPGERLALMLSDALRKIVLRRGALIGAQRLVLGEAERLPQPDPVFECRCGLSYLHLHEGDVIHFSGFTTQEHVARKHECQARGLRHTGALTRGTAVTVLGPGFRKGRPTASRRLTLEQFNTARTRVLPA